MMVTNTVGARRCLCAFCSTSAPCLRNTPAFSAAGTESRRFNRGSCVRALNEENSMKVAVFIRSWISVPLVITDLVKKLLAFTGTGDDHHLPGRPISSAYTRRAIETGE